MLFKNTLLPKNNFSAGNSLFVEHPYCLKYAVTLAEIPYCLKNLIS